MHYSSQCATQRTLRLLSAWAMVLMMLALGAGTAYGGPQTASSDPQQLNFGPFACQGCPSKVFTHHFIAEPGIYQMVVWAEGVGQAKIILNGQVVFGPALFPGHPVVLGAAGPLGSHNTLKIKVWDNSYDCKIWVSFKPVPQSPPPAPPAPQPEPCDPCQPPAPQPEPCDPCQPPAPQPEPCDPCQPPAPQPEPCDPCQPPAPQPEPCDTGCGPSTTVNQVNTGDGDNRDNVALIDEQWGFYPYGRTTVNQVNAGNGNDRNNMVEMASGGGSGYTIVNQLNLGNGNDRGNIFEGTSQGACGPGGCTKINQVNLGDGNNRFNLASMLAQW